MISTNLSYGIYLTQFAVFHYNIGTLRTSVHFDFISTIVSCVINKYLFQSIYLQYISIKS